MPSKLTDPPIDRDHRSILPAEPVALFSAGGDNVRMSAIEDPEYPERPFIRMFLSGFDNGAWKDASLNWIEETQENAVEVIATSSTGKTVALEHTLIELFTGEKYDSTILIGVVEIFEAAVAHALKPFYRQFVLEFAPAHCAS